MIHTTPQKITAEELLNLSQDGFHYELLQGELRKMSPAGYRHGQVAANLTISLGYYVLKHKLGKICVAETGFKIASNPDTVLAPDFAFIRKDRIEQVATSQGFGSGSPDLVVEVISPSDSYQSVEEKVTTWLEAGVSLVMIVNPRKKTVAVYRSPKNITLLNENEELDAQELIPGWSMKVSELFE
jgi:Uma2 family endonuclease